VVQLKISEIDVQGSPRTARVLLAEIFLFDIDGTHMVMKCLENTRDYFAIFKKL
jgi:hypothetical protein